MIPKNINMDMLESNTPDTGIGPTSSKDLSAANTNQEKKVTNIVESLSLKYVQLHGDEDVNYCNQIQKKCKVIKAFRVDKEINIDLIRKYYNCCDLILFDTFTKKYGGSGKKFDWDLLMNSEIEKNFILSGGINFDDIEKINYLKSKSSFFYGVDINSKFEFTPGKKDIKKIEEFLKNII